LKEVVSNLSIFQNQIFLNTFSKLKLISSKFSNKNILFILSIILGNILISSLVLKYSLFGINSESFLIKQNKIFTYFFIFFSFFILSFNLKELINLKENRYDIKFFYFLGVLFLFLANIFSLSDFNFIYIPSFLFVTFIFLEQSIFAKTSNHILDQYKKFNFPKLGSKVTLNNNFDLKKNEIVPNDSIISSGQALFLTNDLAYSFDLKYKKEGDKVNAGSKLLSKTITLTAVKDQNSSQVNQFNSYHSDNSINLKTEFSNNQYFQTIFKIIIVLFSSAYSLYLYQIKGSEISLVLFTFASLMLFSNLLRFFVFSSFVKLNFIKKMFCLGVVFNSNFVNKYLKKIKEVVFILNSSDFYNSYEPVSFQVVDKRFSEKNLSEILQIAFSSSSYKLHSKVSRFLNNKFSFENEYNLESFNLYNDNSIHAVISDVNLYIGSVSFLLSNGVQFSSDEINDQDEKLYIAVNNDFIGSISLLNNFDKLIKSLINTSKLNGIEARFLTSNISQKQYQSLKFTAGEKRIVDNLDNKLESLNSDTKLVYLSDFNDKNYLNSDTLTISNFNSWMKEVYTNSSLVNGDIEKFVEIFKSTFRYKKSKLLISSLFISLIVLTILNIFSVINATMLISGYLLVNIVINWFVRMNLNSCYKN